MWTSLSRYPSVEALCERHEGLVRFLGRRYAKPGSPLLNSWDLQQQLRLTIVDVWQRHAGAVRPEVDAVVRTALRRTVGNLFIREARLRRDDEAFMVMVTVPGRLAGEDVREDGFKRLFELYFEAELRECLSDISATVLWELTHPSPRLVRAMRQAAVFGRGGIAPVARHFHLPPWVFRSVLCEIRGAFSEFFGVPRKSLSLRYLYR